MSNNWLKVSQSSRIKYKADEFKKFLIDQVDSIALPSVHEFKIFHPKTEQLEDVINQESSYQFIFNFAKCEKCNLMLCLWFKNPPNHNELNWGVDRIETAGLFTQFNVYFEDVHGCNIRIMENALL